MKNNWILTFCILLAATTRSLSVYADPPPKTVETSKDKEQQAVKRIIDEDYLDNKWKQSLGYSLLGSGLGIVVIGAVLTAVDSWGDIGKAGFISIGAGLGISFVGMFFLGFSRPVHDLKPSRHTASFSAAPTLNGRGATMAYEIYF